MNRREFTKRFLAVASALSCGIVPKPAKAKAECLEPIGEPTGGTLLYEYPDWELRGVEENKIYVSAPLLDINGITIDHVYLGQETERVYSYVLAGLPGSMETDPGLLLRQARNVCFPDYGVAEGFKYKSHFVTVLTYEGENIATGTLTVTKRDPADESPYAYVYVNPDGSRKLIGRTKGEGAEILKYIGTALGPAELNG